MKNRILFIIIMGCHVEVALTQIIPNPPGRPQKEPPTEYIKQIEDRYKRNKYNEISLKEYIEVYKNSYEVDSIVSRYLLSAANETLKTSAEETCTNGDISRWTPLGTSQLCPNGMFQELTGWWFAHSLVDNSGDIAARKVTVDNNNKLISFWYAVVFEEPGHPPSDQPSFTVVVIDGSGNSYNNLVDLGNGSNKLVSGPDPFFQSGSGIIRYRNWTCAQIDLSNFQNGEQVEIHFIVEDCAQGKHYGYAYIDDFCDDCSGNPSGNILFGGCREPGKICIDYELPKQNTNTGSVALKLDIFQNGTLIGTLNSPSLNTGNNYCFDIDCLKFLNKIDLSTGYDVICTGTFKLGSSNVGTKKIGSIPDGSVLGINNDCSCSPSSVGEIKLTLGKDSCLTSFPFAIQGT
ncbi:MAG: hypothetical protein L6Q66_14450, partial [Bacteroidia bacterium]|nr:hypothetical protein [Bacteroidia bacterium]